MAHRRDLAVASRVPWFVLAGAAVVLLIVWGMTWRGLTLGVISRGVLELWVHGRQPGWLDWVPFIHPPGYSLFMNGTDSLAALVGVEPASLVFWGGGVATLGAAALTTGAAARWLGTGPAVWVAMMVTLSPQNLRPFEHYPWARLLFTAAFVAVIDRLDRPEGGEGGRAGARWDRGLILAAVACVAAVELHLSSWFVLGPLLGLLAIRGAGRAARLVLGALLGVFFLSTLLGLWEVLEFGVGHKPGRGQISFEWASPLLLLALIPALLVGPMRRAAAGLMAFCGITFVLQAMQVADGSPWPTSLHYFELIGPAAVLVAAATLVRLGREGARWLPSVLAVTLLAAQVALLGRGLAALFVQPRWMLMLW